MRVSIIEAAQRLQMSTDSVRRHLRTGRLHGERDHRGQWWLDLPDDAQAEPRLPGTGERLGIGVGTPLHRSERESLIQALEDQIDDLKARLDRSEAARAKLLSIIERLMISGSDGDAGKTT